MMKLVVMDKLELSELIHGVIYQFVPVLNKLVIRTLLKSGIEISGKKNERIYIYIYVIYDTFMSRCWVITKTKEELRKFQDLENKKFLGVY